MFAQYLTCIVANRINGICVIPWHKAWIDRETVPAVGGVISTDYYPWRFAAKTVIKDIAHRALLYAAQLKRGA